jgi:ABC-type glycerol-3-phosphate transport system substrate-binding protein
MRTGLIALIVAAAVFVGCGGDTEQGDAGAVTDASEAVDETADAIGDVEIDANQEIADQYADTSSKELAVTCRQIGPYFSEEDAAKIMERILGRQIIQQGGDVEEVVDLMLDRC